MRTLTRHHGTTKLPELGAASFEVKFEFRSEMMLVSIGVCISAKAHILFNTIPPKLK